MAYDKVLKPHESIPKTDKPVLVCILDGWGENENKDKFNAIHSAQTPVTDALKGVPGRWRTVRAHGTAVGLPSDADMGNSEVGHNALGTALDQGHLQMPDRVLFKLKIPSDLFFSGTRQVYYGYCSCIHF